MELLILIMWIVTAMIILLLFYSLSILKEWYLIIKSQSLYDYEQTKKNVEPKHKIEPETMPLYDE